MRLVLLLCPLWLSLAGCEDIQADSTRREILKLAYRTSQFQEALERCEADPTLLERHTTVWKANFDAAAKWLDIDPGLIANRQEAGRGGLPEDAELGCKIVVAASRISFDTAERWASRIEDEEYCSLMGCE